MKPVLEIKNISKKYNIQANNKPYLSLRESLFSFLKPGTRKEDFWALNDVSFEVEQGDTVGIIGKNGAGKSTLLKILSKITPPTSGSITCRGRIASLLEVGTGFHPELSGRENIFMNGSILGMRKAEIAKNFDAIVDFSGVEKFINTPLKHYSSGMQLRLAFAVAAFLENEILVIDEVLAVGDAEFQKKCMRKMGDVSRSGRTILFVSHNMSAIAQLCASSVYLIDGVVKQTGTTADVIGAYISNNAGNDKQAFRPENRLGPGNVIVSDLVLNKRELLSGERMRLEFRLSKKVAVNSVFIDFRIDNHFGEKCFWISDKLILKPETAAMTDKIVYEIPRLNLNIGLYNITYCLYVNDVVEDMADHCVSFEVLESDFYPNWKFPPKEQSNVLAEFTTRYE
ncbi:MAG TPA: polysaccharide ABC transporter ATP-binding protein [Bacteroidia bacterium]|nr:polysaccharide ABC transporter ATP-binding protein [Bacteroidia bacterium]